MYALALQPPFCQASGADANCGWNLAVPAFYFISFFILTNCAVLPLLTAVILDAYQQSQEATQGGGGATALHSGGAHRLSVLEAELYAAFWSEQASDGGGRAAHSTRPSVHTPLLCCPPACYCRAAGCHLLHAARPAPRHGCSRAGASDDGKGKMVTAVVALMCSAPPPLPWALSFSSPPPLQLPSPLGPAPKASRRDLVRRRVSVSAVVPASPRRRGAAAPDGMQRRQSAGGGAFNSHGESMLQQPQMSPEDAEATLAAYADIQTSKPLDPLALAVRRRL